MSDSIVVVGGAYGEECAYPRKKIYRGSGGRASAFLSSIGVNTDFHTYLGKDLLPTFKEISRSFGFALIIEEKDSDIWFRYRHPLSKPTILNPLSSIKANKKIETKQALVFGTLEERPRVVADKVVYDPQNGYKSEMFEANGSQAKELALLVSYSEGKALTGKTSPKDMADSLISNDNMSVVIIKCGPQGALVKTKEKEGWVKPFVTRRVYKIGSGDIFSAAFAYSWLIKDSDPFIAAWFASKATATYVESGSDRFSYEQIDLLEIDANKAHDEFKKYTPREIPDTQIYLAGPFFNTSQQWLIEEARDILTEMGFNVFSPIHEIGIGPVNDVASEDITALEDSGIVFALLDGMDAGTLFEVGYARAKNIPVVAVAETAHEKDLTMIIGSGCEVSNDFSTGVYALCWHLMGDV